VPKSHCGLRTGSLCPAAIWSHSHPKPSSCEARTSPSFPGGSPNQPAFPGAKTTSRKIVQRCTTAVRPDLGRDRSFEASKPPWPHQSAFIERYLPASSSLSEIRHPETPVPRELATHQDQSTAVAADDDRVSRHNKLAHKLWIGPNRNASQFPS
jgi:hypothetical protein